MVKVRHNEIKLWSSGAYTCAQLLFHCCNLDINPMTLKLEGDPGYSENVPSQLLGYSIRSSYRWMRYMW